MKEFDPSCYYDDYLSLEDGSIIYYPVLVSKYIDYILIKVSDNIVLRYDYVDDEYIYFKIKVVKLMWFFGDVCNPYDSTMLGEFL